MVRSTSKTAGVSGWLILIGLGLLVFTGVVPWSRPYEAARTSRNSLEEPDGDLRGEDGRREHPPEAVFGGIRFNHIPPGRFLMGSPDFELGRDPAKCSGR